MATKKEVPEMDVEATEKIPEMYSRRKLARTANALAILAGRSCPSLDADLKAGRLHRIFSDAVEGFDKARNSISMKLLEGTAIKDLDKLTPLANERLAGQIAVAQAAFDETLVEFEWPKWKIKKSDLPKEKTGDEGWKNGTAIGAITSGLGDLFDWSEIKDET